MEDADIMMLIQHNPEVVQQIKVMQVVQVLQVETTLEVEVVEHLKQETQMVLDTVEMV